jgi:1-aminocyclopropane-1-carboxylate deaminase/D-cysteine desulfhydrase-like pyridoxal-dependent ACC family enzyme
VAWDSDKNNFILHSRIHPLKRYIVASPNRRVFLKRDDELSSGITGSKYRKFASLVPHLLQEKYDEVLLIGSSQSNNVVGLVQLLIENGIPYRLLLLEANEEKLIGNRIWLKLLSGDAENIDWLTRVQWTDANKIADKYRQEQAQDGKRIFIIREGAAVPEALPGAMTLAEDILRNEKESDLTFQHIFIDSGTGMSAIGLLSGLNKAGIKDKTIHITLIAGSEAEFWKRHEFITGSTTGYVGEIQFHQPAIAPSFGSMTTAVLNEVKAIAKLEGILVEPVYTAKHFYTAKKIIETGNLKGNILIINSGGALGLSGFMNKLM